MPVGAEDQPRLHVRVVPRLPPEAEHVRRPRTRLAEGVVEVGGEQRPVAARPLGHIPPLVEGVPEGAGGGQAVGLGVVSVLTELHTICYHREETWLSFAVSHHACWG